MPTHWYTLHSHHHKEELLYQQLLSCSLEGYYPVLKVKPVNPRSRKIQPYFPGYLFLHADLEKVGLSVLNWMPYGNGIVSFGGEPAIVPENLIQAIRQRVDEINLESGPARNMAKPGDEVHIQSGPFAGYDAIFDTHLPGSERVRVLLKMLNQARTIPIEMQSGAILLKKTSK